MNLCLGLRCSTCLNEYGIDEIQYTCPKDGGNLDVLLDIHCLRQNYRPEDLLTASEASIWRYKLLLPVDDPGYHETPLHSVGCTPFYSPPTLADQLGMQSLWIKDESRNPTASFKDRASAIVVAKGLELKAKVIVTASTGNAGAALAGMAAAVEQPVVIFAPRTAPPAKVAQLLVYGAQVLLVEGTYDDAFDLSIQAAQEFGWYCRNTGYNPYTTEGKKTAAYEIWEFIQHRSPFSLAQKRWNVFVSVGDGNIISGIHKGFQDLFELGWIDTLPRLFGVQAEGSAAIANAFFRGDGIIQPVSANTIADSIAVDLPRDGLRALRAMHKSGGRPVLVSDAEIIIALASLGRAGIFAEPAGAAAYAGLEKAVKQHWIELDDPVIVINTGNGLKDVGTAMQAVVAAPIIEPTLEAVKRMVK